MRTTKTLTGSLTLALLAPLGAFSAGCSTSPSTETGAPIEGEQAAVTSLATLNVGYGTIEFQKLTAPDGSFHIGMQEFAPNTAISTPVDSLLTGRRLTSLEVFRAIAPDQQAPTLITEMHPVEAGALGRSDATVLSVAFDRNAPVEKSAASCDAWALQDTNEFEDWDKVRKVNSVSGDKWLAVGNSVADWSFPTTARVTMGVCNESNVAIQGRIAWDTDADSVGWIYSGFSTINVGIRWRWWNFSKSTPNCANVPPGLICVSQFAVRYGVNGVSPAGKLYHQRSAVIGPEKCTTVADCPGSFYRCSAGICVPEPH